MFTNKQARDERGVPLGMTEEQAAKVVEVVSGPLSHRRRRRRVLD